MSEWQELTDLVGDKPFTVTEVRLADRDIAVRGEFELPPLAGLRFEDQVFVSEFVRCHGSIKYMEKAFGISSSLDMLYNTLATAVWKDNAQAKPNAITLANSQVFFNAVPPTVNAAT